MELASEFGKSSPNVTSGVAPEKTDLFAKISSPLFVITPIALELSWVDILCKILDIGCKFENNCQRF